MTTEPPNPSPEEETLARHKVFAEVLQGQRPMKWSDWSMFIYESRCLTLPGQRVTRWAVDTLEQALGTDFLHQPLAVPLLLSLGLWPSYNDVPWVYANLFQLAAQMNLLDIRLRPVLRTMRFNLDITNWTHTLLQLELAGLGLRAEWQVLLEPELGTGRKADIQLSNETTKLLVEVRAVGLSNNEQKADAFFLHMVQRMNGLAWQYEVHISGILGDIMSAEVERQWLGEIEATASATAQDGVTRLVQNSTGGRVEISKGTGISGVGNLEGVVVETDVGHRLMRVLNEKNQQAEGGGPIWVRLDEHAGLWQFPLQGMTLQEKLASLTLYLQMTLVSFPNLAGVILSPAVLWAGNAPLEVLTTRIESSEGIALRCSIPGYRVRESIIVARAGVSDIGSRIFADWYAQEATWLDWALKQLGHPPFDALVQELHP